MKKLLPIFYLIGLCALVSSQIHAMEADEAFVDVSPTVKATHHGHAPSAFDLKTLTEALGGKTDEDDVDEVQGQDFPEHKLPGDAYHNAYVKGLIEINLKDECRKDPEKLVNGLQKIFKTAERDIVKISPDFFIMQFHRWLKGIEVDKIQDSNLSGPLHYAAGFGHVLVCEVLLKMGVEVTRRDKSGHSPLTKAGFKGHKNTCKLLMGAFTDLSEVKAMVDNPLKYRAAQEAFDEVVAGK